MTALRARLPDRADVRAALCYLALAVFVTSGLWRSPNGRVLVENRDDHAFFAWLLSNNAHTVADRRYPFFSDWLNAPKGVNLMANNSIWLESLPLTPVTLTLGPFVALAIALAAGLAGTAAAWYQVLSRHVV